MASSASCSIGVLRSTSFPSSLPATAAFASLLPIDSATRRTVVPLSHSLMDPSGSVSLTILMGTTSFAVYVQCNVAGQRPAEAIHARGAPFAPSRGPSHRVGRGLKPHTAIAGSSSVSRATTIGSCNKAASVMDAAFPNSMVGASGFEPLTSTVSRWRSPPELSARSFVRRPAIIAASRTDVKTVCIGASALRRIGASALRRPSPVV